MTLVNVPVHVWQKIVDILHYPLGWLAGLGLFMLDALSGGRLVIYLVIIATCLDLVCGISVSVRQYNFAKSELMRLTVEKLTVYGAAMLIFLCIDKAIAAETSWEFALTSGVVGVVIAMTETWSMLASLLILFPDNPFLKLLQKALTGEIARKLGCEEEEVAAILKAKRRKKAMPRGKDGRFVPKDAPQSKKRRK